MSNEYYTPTGWPGTSATGSSAPGRSEMIAIKAGFDKLPVLIANDNLPVVVNPTGTGLTVMSYADFIEAAGLGPTDTPTFLGTVIAAGGVGGGSAGTLTAICKAVAAIANNTATTVFTLTVPNSAQAACLRVTLMASLGAGGSVGADEASATASYDIVVARTAGVAVAATESVAYGAATANVAGANSPTISITLVKTGAVGVTNTVDVKITIARSGGASTNHTCFAKAELLNANGSGITIA